MTLFSSISSLPISKIVVNFHFPVNVLQRAIKISTEQNFYPYDNFITDLWKWIVWFKIIEIVCAVFDSKWNV